MFVGLIAVKPLISCFQNIVYDNVLVAVVFRWFLFSLPQNMIFTFPMASLFASFLVFGRISKNPEINDMRTGELNFFRLLIPLIAFAILITMLSFIFNEAVVPFANKRTNEIRRCEIMRLCEPETDESVCMQSSDGAFIFARKVFESKGLMEEVLLDYYLDGLLTRRITADYAQWDGNWTFSGVADRTYIEGRFASFVVFPFLKISTVTETPAVFVRHGKRPNEMNYSELKSLIEIYERTKSVYPVNLKMELAMKTSLPFATILFTLIGASLGWTSYRSSAFIGFAISIVIFFVYYVIMKFSIATGKSGVLPVFLSAWLTNIIFAFFGVFLALRAGLSGQASCGQ